MTAPTPTEAPAPGAESNSGALSPTPEGEGTGEPKANKEARYRVERNEARVERDALAARIEQLQLRDALRLAGEHLAQPADLLALGNVTLADLLDDDGNVDHEAVAGAAAAVIESRPGLAKNPKVFATDPTQGSGSPLPAKATPTFGDLLKA